MFKYSLDEKPEIEDNNGNTIIDLVKPFFSKSAERINDYMVRKVGAQKFSMRPDLVSFAMYGDDEGTEYILKFSGISNPFSLDKDDVLLIPNDQQVYGMMNANSDEDQRDTYNLYAQIRNSFKYYDATKSFPQSQDSYNNFAKTKIPSLIKDTGEIQNNTGNIMVPYISQDGTTSVTIRNGRVYLGTDSGIQQASSETIQQSANITSIIQNAINKASTQLSDSNCLYNGTNLADFVRSNFNNR